MKRLNRRQHRAIRSMKSVITDSLGGQKVVKSFAREEQEVDRFDSRNGNYFNTRMVSSYYGASRFPLLRMLYRVSEIAIFGLGAIFVIRGNVT